MSGWNDIRVRPGSEVRLPDRRKRAHDGEAGMAP
jgi:hypothetical protein